MWNSTKILWNHECFHALIRETYKMSKMYNKIHGKVYEISKNISKYDI